MTSLCLFLNKCLDQLDLVFSSFVKHVHFRVCFCCWCSTFNLIDLSFVHFFGFLEFSKCFIQFPAENKKWLLVFAVLLLSQIGLRTKAQDDVKNSKQGKDTFWNCQRTDNNNWTEDAKSCLGGRSIDALHVRRLSQTN